MSKASRAEVYAAIDTERAYQDAGRGNAKSHKQPQEPLTLEGGIVVLDKILGDVKLAWYKPGGVDSAMDYIRKIGGVAVQLMENYGAPPRQ